MRMERETRDALKEQDLKMHQAEEARDEAARAKEDALKEEEEAK